MSPFQTDSYQSLLTPTCPLWNLSALCAHFPPATLFPPSLPLISFLLPLCTFLWPPFACSTTPRRLPFVHYLHLLLPGPGPALCCAPTAPAGQPVSSRAKRLRPLSSPSYLSPASAATASTSQSEPELWWGLLRGPGTSASAISATAAGPGAGPASGSAPAATELHRTTQRPTGRPAHASGSQIYWQLRRLLLGLSAIQWTELRDQPLPGLAWLLGLVRLWWLGGGGRDRCVRVCVCVSV